MSAIACAVVLAAVCPLGVAVVGFVAVAVAELVVVVATVAVAVPETVVVTLSEADIAAPDASRRGHSAPVLTRAYWNMGDVEASCCFALASELNFSCCWW